VSAINDAGLVVGTGTVFTPDGKGNRFACDHACVWTKGADGLYTVQDLGVLPGETPGYEYYEQSEAFGIDGSGRVVGYSEYWFPITESSGNFIRKAVLWSGGTILDLNTLLTAEERTRFELTEARSINDAGQIVGIGTDLVSGREFGFLLTLPAAPVAP
jgi:uncharacterized membrane protein